MLKYFQEIPLTTLLQNELAALEFFSMLHIVQLVYSFLNYIHSAIQLSIFKFQNKLFGFKHFVVDITFVLALAIFSSVNNDDVSSEDENKFDIFFLYFFSKKNSVKRVVDENLL